MKGKIKNQKRKIILKISSIMLAVFIVVSLVFSAITLSAEKETQITKSHNDFIYMNNAITSMTKPPYNEMCKYANVVKSHLRDMVSDAYIDFTNNSGVDGTADDNIHIQMYDWYFETEEKILLMDTDKEIYFNLFTEYGTDYFSGSGLLNYDEFIDSITEENLSTIKEYLVIEKDEDGYFYLLVCKDAYYCGENGHIYPKTVEIVKAYEDSHGYGIAETLETFELNPKNTEGLTLYQAITNEPCVIEGQFVCNNFSSDNLIDTELGTLDYTIYDPDTGLVEKDGLFTYKHSEYANLYIQSLGFEGNKNEIVLKEHLDYVYGNYEADYEYPYKDIIIRYAKRINLLEYCGDTLAIGITIIFLFFLVITLILIVMMCKMMKTQLSEEEKRSELTNALAHDIKTPLFIISGYAQNLKENVNTDKRDHYCDRIIDKTQEVNELVHKMLELSRFDSLEKAILKEDIDLKTIIKGITDNYESLPDKKSFELNFADKCTIKADPKLLSRAISNLISNATFYSDIESVIRIDVSDNAFSISNKCSNISQSDIKHLTEPYYRVEKNRNSKGNGLGLSIVKSIVELHSYTLDIKLCDDTITFKIAFRK